MIILGHNSTSGNPWSASPNWISTDSEFTMSVALADLDNDNDLDLIAGNYKYPYQIPEVGTDVVQPANLQLNEIGAYLCAYRWDTNQYINPVNLISNKYCIDCIAVADYDKDGDLDIAAGLVVGKGGDGGVIVFKNHRIGMAAYLPLNSYFSEIGNWQPNESYDCHCVRWADVDNDGDLDLVALEVPGKVHIYTNVTGNLNKQISVMNFYKPPSPHIKSSSSDYDGLSSVSLDLPVDGTTIEFGDMNGDGLLDMFLNVNIYGDYVDRSSMQIFENTGVSPYYNGDEWILAASEQILDDNFCASFGHYRRGDSTYLALVTGSMNFQQGSDISKSACGNDIYIFNGVNLDHVAKSVIDESVTTKQAQLVSDIQWVDLDGNDTLDIVAVSYPVYKKTGTGISNSDFAWDRGKEIIHMNPDSLFFISSNEYFTSNCWNNGHDLSTSLALGDIDNPDSCLISEIFNIDTSNIKGLFYVDKYPFFRILAVYHKHDSTETNWVMLGISKWSADPLNGWVSIDLDYLNSHLGSSNSPQIKVDYYWSNHYDLVVGNDGPNVVYFWNGGAGSSISSKSVDLENVPAGGSSERIYSKPASLYGNNVDLMSTQSIGFTGEVYNPIDITPYISTYPDLKRIGIQYSWNKLEIFQGHYFWDYLDKNLDAVQNNNGISHIVMWVDPMWARGNYAITSSNNDSKKRSSRMALNTLAVRNLVNRYRPGGVIGSCNTDNGYGWGTGSTGWGAQIYQFENEPNYATCGYGGYDEARKDIAGKTYLQFQIMKWIANDAYGDQSKIKLVSPNWGPDRFDTHNTNIDVHMTPPLPYLNQLHNNGETPWKSLYGAQHEQLLWYYCDYIATQIYGGKNPHNDEFCRYIDNYTPDYYNGKRLGFEQKLWSYYTPGIGEYLAADSAISSGEISDYAPIMTDTTYEKPFFIFDVIMENWFGNMSANENIPTTHWNAARIAEMFSADVYPDDPNKTKRLVECFPDRWPQCQTAFQTIAPLMNDKFDIDFDQYQQFIIGGDDTLHCYTYKYETETGIITDNTTGYLHFLKTHQRDEELFLDDQYVDTTYNFTLKLNYLESGARVDCYNPDGSEFQKTVVNNGAADYIVFQPYELGPGMLIVDEFNMLAQTGCDQSLQIRPGWNLLSWNIVPLDNVGPSIEMSEILPADSAHMWFHDSLYDGQVYNKEYFNVYYPDTSTVNTWNWVWDLHQAYYLYIRNTYDWGFSDRPAVTLNAFTIDPDTAWDDYCEYFGEDSYASGWYFMGYPGSGYSKLATIFNNPANPSGDPDDCEYLGPFHWLMWSNTTPYSHIGPASQYLIIVKNDEGKVYIPVDVNLSHPPYQTDEIGFLEPGRGYFLGFNLDTTSISFNGWSDYPGGDNIAIGPGKNSPNAVITSAGHFQYNKYTHWSYPVVIDTVDLTVTAMSPGDEIGVFNGLKCVGAGNYEGAFPLVIACWKDDIATPDSVDGYTARQPMTFVWYDVSENQELIFTPPTVINTAEPDDRIAPTHSGFGAGMYALRSFYNGIQSYVQLPTEFKLGANYPNPFNSTTIIPLELPERSRIKIQLYNIQGRLVGKIYEGIENAGWPKIRYHAGNLASGIYFCRVTADGLERGGRYSAVSKLLLLK